MPRVSDVDSIAPENTAPPVLSPAPIVETTASPVANFNLNDKVYEIFGHTKSSFSSTLIFPKVFSFAEQDDNETILIALRPHWFTNVSWILLSLVLFICPILFKYVPLIDTLPVKYLFVFSLFWYTVSTAFSFEKFMSWYFDVYVITNRRVIDIDFYNLLIKKFSEAELSKIQDVTSQVAGLSQTVFNYGNVLIQTAAEIDEITFTKIPHPERVVKIIQEMTEDGRAK
jgi:hypothetical protein